ncbi:MAG: 30S ribosomal protein S5 [Pseudomonadota bacterium]
MTTEMKREGHRDRDNRGDRDNRRGGGAGAKGEYTEKVICVKRTAKVVKGGRKFGFSAYVVIGDGMGMVGVGHGKAGEVPDAIRKALDEARRDLFQVSMRKGKTLHHTIIANHGATRVFMQPASEGTGVIAGGAMRAVFEVAGIGNVLAKCYGSTNPVNVVRATMKALKSMQSPRQVAEKRGKSVAEVLGVAHD